MTNHDVTKEQIIRNLSRVLRTRPFQVELKVKKRPKGVKVVIDVTKEQIDGMMNKAKRHKEDEHEDDSDNR